MQTVTLLLTLTLALSACVPSGGDFCDVGLDLRTTSELSALIYDTDEAFARNLAVHNTMYGGC